MSDARDIGSEIVEHELAHLQKQWWCFLALGITMVVLGTAAIAAPCVSSLVGIKLLGILLLGGGIIQVVSAFWMGQWSGFFLCLLTGLLYLVVGVMIVENPLGGLVALTLLLAAIFIVSGIAKIVVSLQGRFAHWGWALVSGIVTLLLGLILWSRLKEGDGLWFIGLMIGIELLFNGWTWVMLGLSVRTADKA